VSILSRLGLKSHLSEADLTALWADQALDVPATPLAAEARAHLHDCAECRGRYTTLNSWLDTTRSDARAMADEAFPPERLAAQHAQILRRLEAVERPARVIKFPRFTTAVAAHHGGRQRWIAGAAAAGLIVGIGLGRLVDFGQQTFPTTPRQPDQIVRVPARPDGRGAIQPVSGVASNDEVFLTEMELSTSRARVPEALREIDAITPGARDPR
jgi:hypothetical protein